MLAFWSNRDPVQIERIISARERGQRDRWKDRPDYRRRTIDAAIARSAARYDPVAADVTETYQPFPTELLPGVVADFVRQSAAAIGCDEAMISLILLVAFASAIGNSRRIRLKETWTEPAILWGAVIAPSGTKKSPAFKAASAAVWEKQAETVRQYQEQYTAYEQKHNEWKRTKNGDEPQPLARFPHYVLSDVTVEALADRLQDSPRGTLVLVDELSGWFAGFGQYKNGRGGDAQAYLSMFNAHALKVDRKTGDKTTIYVPSASVSIAGGVQPQILQRCLSREFLENGMASRLLFAMPPQKIGGWTGAVVDARLAAEIRSIFTSLYGLIPHAPPCEPADMIPTKEAKVLLMGHVNRVAAELNKLRASDPMRAALSKLEGAAARLALVLQCVADAASGKPQPPDPNNPYRVTVDQMKAGIALAEWFEREARRVYSMMKRVDGIDDSTAQLVQWIRQRGGKTTVRELRQGMWRYREKPDLAESDLNALVNAGRGQWKVQKPDGPGRPSTLFILSE
jgi:hypothetical protein